MYVNHTSNASDPIDNKVITDGDLDYIFGKKGQLEIFDDLDVHNKTIIEVNNSTVDAGNSSSAAANSSMNTNGTSESSATDKSPVIVINDGEDVWPTIPYSPPSKKEDVNMDE